jgi:arylsulfatase A-like enzyme
MVLGHSSVTRNGTEFISFPNHSASAQPVRSQSPASWIAILPAMHRLPSLALAVLVSLTAIASPAAAAAPDFVLITVDTLRADHLGAYGYARDTSPNIDALAREALLFEHALAPMPMTLPSHVSLLTSSLPSRHGVLSNFRFLQIPFVPGDAAGLRSAAQILTEAGYATAAFTSASPLSRGTGIDVGFRDFEAPPPFDDAGQSTRRDAAETVDLALRWLATAPTPCFLWVHLFDPHMPYEPPPPHDTAFETDDALRARLARSGVPDVLQRYAARATNLYDGEIRYTDEQLGRLFDALRKRGTWDDGVIALTADHGEGLLEHGEAGHQYLWRSTIGVPLVLRWPGGPRGVRSNRIASLLDVLPTLAAHTALPLGAAARFDGSDLLAEAAGEALALEPVLAAAPNLRTYALRTQHWKLWHRPDAGEQLYRVDRDPGELHELSAEHPDVTQRLLARIDALLREARSRPGVVVSEEIDPQLRERLRQLGYAE